MLAWWGGAVYRFRGRVLAATAAFLAFAVVWGTGVFGALGDSGFDDPDSEASLAADAAESILGGGHDLLVLVVFLLSRIREQWDLSGDNRLAVATGLQRTGGLITSAALLLVVVIGAFSTSGITFIKMIGIGMVLAIVIDATVVRALLVPATMRLLGSWNWWLPAPLERVWRRVGIREHDALALPLPPGEVEQPVGAVG